MSTPLPLPLPPPSPPQLDPPFRGYIETTYDSLLVFEAARRGLIPRVTRRLIERERGMVQSGAVFVFDEQESGIKRWTDGLVWSPSRILGNFLVYRETDKRPTNASGTSSGLSGSPNQGSPSGTPSRSMAPPGQYAESSLVGSHSTGEIPILAQGAIRPRSASESGMDRQMERQLVGSLTNSYKFKEGGLVKKTMSVSIGNYSQHMISYYTLEDVMAGRLRTPSTIPELAALQINQEYLQQQNFRFPPMIEVGQDGIVRYRGEAEEPMSPNTPMSGLSMHSFPTPSDHFDPFNQVHMQMDAPRHHHRVLTHPPHIPIPLPPQHPHHQPHSISHAQSLSPAGYGQTGSSAGSQYFDTQYPGLSASAGASTGPSASAQPIPIQRQVSGGSGGVIRPSSSSRGRYDPYGASASPRMAALGVSSSLGQHPIYGVAGSSSSSASGSSSASQIYRRQSGPGSHTEQLHHHPQSQTQAAIQQAEYYQQYDVKPTINAQGVATYVYQPPATAPGSFAEFYDTQHPASAPTSAPATAGGATSASAYGTSPAGQQISSHSHAPHQPHYTAGPVPVPISAPAWQSTPAPPPNPGSQSRLLPAQPSPVSQYGLSPVPGHSHPYERSQGGPNETALSSGSSHSHSAGRPQTSGPGGALGYPLPPPPSLAGATSPHLQNQHHPPLPHASGQAGGAGAPPGGSGTWDPATSGVPANPSQSQSGLPRHSHYSPAATSALIGGGGGSQPGAVEMGQYSGDEWR